MADHRSASSAPRRPARAAVLVFAAAAAFAALAAPPAAAARRPFAPPGTAPVYMPARTYDLLHRQLDLAFDWQGRRVSGTAVNRLTPLLPGTRHVDLHAVGLAIERVTVNGVEAVWEERPGDGTLRVDLGRAVAPPEEVEVAVTYSARPRAGLYFVGGEPEYPDKPAQVWSQGESEFNRHWFPSWDHPNDRATTEAAYTVPAGWRAIGNGRLVGVDELPDGRRTFRWAIDQPHVNYLVSIVAGELVEVEDTPWQGVPIVHYVPAGYEDEARRSFGKTPEMMRLFADLTGVPYPYDKYAQTTAVDFIWGGMENVSATTQTIDTLHDERAATDVSSDGLVAHELAHQWFGDLVTCRTWAHCWLNEGFATYFTGIWREHAEGPDDFAWEVWGWRDDYFAEDARVYRRPIVTHRYPFPMALFDRHLYDKGALVLHMVRDWTGDAGWWRGIGEYLDRHADQTVVTAQFQTAMEEATGVPLGALFDRYVHGAGHPELTVSWGWDADRGMVRLDVEQTQEITAETGLFEYPVEVALVAADGTTTSHEIRIEPRREQSRWVSAAARPETVVFDPRGVFLAEVDFAKPAAEWAAQLAAGGPLASRLTAIRALGELAGDEAVAALGRAAAGEPFWGARAEAAKALAAIRTGPALAALEPALDDRESKVRREAVEALGAFALGADEADRQRLLARLESTLGSDRSYYARAAAARALGRFAADREVAVPLLVRALGQESHRQVVRAAAIESLARLDPDRAWEPAGR
ncbi:MAG TPA: M1 family metallopeptidase, partial [Thermoanaerobaculia bacterium]